MLAAAAALCLCPPAASAAESPPQKSLPLPADAIEKLFTLFDLNADQSLDADEQIVLHQHLAVMFGEKAAPIVQLVLEAADADHDGRLALAEWQRLMGAALRRDGRKETVRVPMSDGVSLAADVCLPEGDGPFPVLLMRTPYGRQDALGRVFALGGYTVVVQDMRGRFDSEGENLPFIGCGWTPHADGAETVQWIRRQPWCNGRIGTVGASADGITQYLMAGARPEGLAAQYVVVAAPSLYHYAAFVGGALRKEQIEGWLRGHRFDPQAFELYKSHPTYDDFWRQFDSVAQMQAPPPPGAPPAPCPPAVHLGGWFDTFSQGTIDAFLARRRAAPPAAAAGQRLVMGPWSHEVGVARVGDLTFPRAAGVPQAYTPLAWFDYALKGAANAAAKAPTVMYYVMGDAADPSAPGNVWRSADSWPPPCRETPYYLAPDGGLAPAPPPAPAAGAPAFREFTFDPADPCPTLGGRNLNIPRGARKQNRIEGRTDVLVFTSAPLERPLEITGRLRARIFISSSAVDTDLSVRLSDVYPDGSSYLMADGMLRLRFREGFDRARPLEPGRVVAAEVDCWSLSLILNKGHRLRVAVTSSNHPRFDVNPGTGRPPAEGETPVRQTNRIWCGGDYPSRIILPIPPAPAAAPPPPAAK